MFFIHLRYIFKLKCIFNFFNGHSRAFTTKMIDVNKDCSLQQNSDQRLTSKQGNYSSKKSRNKSALNKGSVIYLVTKNNKGRGEQKERPKDPGVSFQRVTI